MLLDNHCCHFALNQSLVTRGDGNSFVAQPTGNVLAGQASKGSEGQLARGCPRAETVLL